MRFTGVKHVKPLAASGCFTGVKHVKRSGGVLGCDGAVGCDSP
jgi:hypothetical protein